MFRKVLFVVFCVSISSITTAQDPFLKVVPLTQPKKVSMVSDFTPPKKPKVKPAPKKSDAEKKKGATEVEIKDAKADKDEGDISRGVVGEVYCAECERLYNEAQAQTQAQNGCARGIRGFFRRLPIIRRLVR